jgi:dTMP kinase
MTREPGGSPFSERIRTLLLEPQDEYVNAKSELLLMFASRVQHVEQGIKPALKKGTWVLCDRFIDATYAYQGAGRQLGEKIIRPLENWCLDGFLPDITLLLDMPVAQSMERVLKRGEPDRFEQEKLDFFERIRMAYLERVQRSKGRMTLIDARGSIESVQQSIKAWMDQKLNKLDV